MASAWSHYFREFYVKSLQFNLTNGQGDLDLKNVLDKKKNVSLIFLHHQTN